jgi:hypothetical protein
MAIRYTLHTKHPKDPSAIRGNTCMMSLGHASRCIGAFLLLLLATPVLPQWSPQWRITCGSSDDLYQKRIMVSAQELDAGVELKFIGTEVHFRFTRPVERSTMEHLQVRSLLEACSAQAYTVPWSEPRDLHTGLPGMGAENTGPPVLQKTGDPERDAAAYQVEKERWIQAHPEIYQRWVQGDLTQPPAER